MDNQGWIKLHRSIIDWEWFDDANTLSLWIHLLLKANYKDSTWHGVEVKRGSMIAGRIELSKMTGISEQSIRTSLAKLKSTSNITIKSTNKYSVISINNYDRYQDNNQQDNQQLTSNQPATNHVLRSKEVKNILSKDNKAYGNANINYLIELFEGQYGYKPTDRKPRQEAWNLIRAIRSVFKEYKKEWSMDKEKTFIDKYFSWITKQEWATELQNMGTVRRKLPIYKSYLERSLNAKK